MSRRRKQFAQFLRALGEMLAQERLYPWMLVTSFVFWLGALALPIWRIVPLAAEQPYLPLHYNVYFGVDRFGPWWHVFVIPALGFLFVLIGLYMQTRFYRTEKMLARFFSISTAFLEVALFVAMVLLVLLNI